MAVVAGVDPTRIGAVVFILSRSKPMRLLLAYFIGGFGLSLIIGFVVLFVLKGFDVGKKSSAPPEILIAVGALALLAAVLVGTGVSARLRDMLQARHPQANVPSLDRPANADESRSIEQMPGFAKLPKRAQTALQSESPWVAWVAGLAVGMPSAYYLAAIAAILNAGVGVGWQISAIFVFNILAFVAAEIPIVGYAIAPDATRNRVDELYSWVNARHRLVVTIVAAVAGAYLLAVGISKL